MTRFPGFTIVAEIGRGGMGVIYKAQQVSTKRIVALKVMLAGAFASPAAKRRFQREVELTARFQHPGIVRVLESGYTPDGQQYFAMDFVDAPQLDHWISTVQPDVHTTLGLFVALCEAVEHAHECGVVHRDLKPANILVDTKGCPHILDFGLSKAADWGGEDGTLAMTVSMPGQVMGTLRYLSPEQAAATPGEVDARTDVYALGVMLFEALTGSLPHDSSGSHSAVMERIREDPPRSPAALSKRVDRELETIILKALEKEQARRYQSAAQFGEDLSRYLSGRPIMARAPSSFYVLRKKLVRQRGRIAVAVLTACLATGGIGGGIWWQSNAVSRQRAREMAATRESVLSGQNSVELGRMAEARGIADRAHALFPKMTDVRLLRAQVEFRAAREQGRLDIVLSTISDIQGALARERGQWPVCALLAEMCREMGEHEQAEELEARARAEAPDTAEAWYLWSLATLDADKAMRHAEHALARDPKHELALKRVLHLSMLRRDYDAALSTIDKLIELEPATRIDYSRQQLRILGRLGRYEQALELCEIALAHFPDSVSYLRDRGSIRLCLDDYDGALADYSKAVDLTGRAAMWERHKRAVPLWMLGRLEEAAEDYREVLHMLGRVSFADARLFLLLHDQARRFDAEGRPADAEKARQDARAVREAACVPSTDEWLKSIFDCLVGELTPAELVAAAESLDPPNEERVCEAYYYAGEACLLADHTAEAREWLQKCVDTDLAFELALTTFDPMFEYHFARWRLRQLSGESDGEPQREGY